MNLHNEDLAGVEIDWHEYEQDIRALCRLKAEEFHLYGYEEVTQDEIWKYIQSTIKGQTSLHQIVERVFTLQAGKFMTYTTINAFKGIFGAEDEA